MVVGEGRESEGNRERAEEGVAWVSVTRLGCDAGDLDLSRGRLLFTIISHLISYVLRWHENT
jgi:hypothetical protein